jgi:hypothetical protein
LGRLRQLLTALAGALAIAAPVVAAPAAQARHHHSKPHCRSGYVPKRVRVRVRRHGRRVWVRRWRCVKSNAYGGALPSMGPEPAPSIFGINHGTFDSVTSDFAKDDPAAQSIGARWDHEVLNPSTATGDFSSSDFWVKAARAHGMGVILSFGGIKSACSQATSNVAGCPPTTPSELSAYQSYIERVLARYHNVVDYYESWKEPNHASQWGGKANPPQYAALLKAQYQAFETFNSRHPHSGPGGSDMKLLFGSPNGFTIQPPSNDMAALPFVEQVLSALGGAKVFDGVALHGYRYEPTNGPNDLESDWVGGLSNRPSFCLPVLSWCPMTWTQVLQSYEQEFTDYGYGQPPMWLTEWGWPGGGDCSSLPKGYCLSTANQDADLKEGIADLLKLPFVRGAMWFNLRDYQPGIATPDPPFFYHYGLLNYDYSHKSAADDFKALAAANPGR